MGGSSAASASSAPASGDKGQRALNDALAGAVSGCVARFVVGPLDVLKIRFQVQTEPVSRRAAAAALSGGSLPKYTGIAQALGTIVREEGVLALFRGMVPGQLLTIPYCAIQFVTSHQAKTLAKETGLLDSPLGPSVSYLSGAAAGVAATVGSYPFDLLRTTLAAQGEPRVYNNMFDAARGIVNKKGFTGLYCGLKPTLVEIVPYAALQFGLYDTLNKGMTNARYRAMASMTWQKPPDRNNMPVNPAQQFLCGFLSGVCAKLGTHPLDVAKKRYQIAGLTRNASYGASIDQSVTKSLFLCLYNIWKKEGLRGLYKGATPSLLKSAPQAAVTFSVYEMVLRRLQKRSSAL